MKVMKSLAVLAVGALAVASAMAQSGAPSDVPRDHWAFSAVDNLYRIGVLKGYPDGTFKGSRPVSRYEISTAVQALMQDQTNGLQQRVREADAKATEAQNAGRQLADLRAAIASLRVSVDELKRQREQVPALTSEFQSLNEQLRQLRESVGQMRQQLGETKSKSGK